MNPTAQSLDPKLKETYDRVMGTVISSQPSASPTPKPVEPTPPPALEHKPFEQPSAPASPQPAAAPAAQVFVSPDTKATVNINPNQAATLKKGHGISPVIYIVLGLIFFAGYTFIWLKVFNIV